MKTSLIIAPHPDDAELAMGGTIAKMITSGWDVIIADLTDGEPTPFGSKQMRAKEVEKASEILGIKKRICLNMPNRSLEASLENRKKVAEIIRLNKPDILFAPAMPDWHPDHKAALELTQAARFQAKYHKTDIAGKPHWTDKLWLYYSPHRRQYPTPSFIIDISELWQKKLAAVRAYQSQLKNENSGQTYNLLKRLEITAKYFGQCIGTAYGEPFSTSEPFCVTSLRTIS